MAAKSKSASKTKGDKGDKVFSNGDLAAKKKKRRPQPQQKSRVASVPPKKKKRTYTDKELGIPELNMITPAGVQKPKGKKKGKIFADDPETMLTILAMVNAEKEGQLESKLLKARQMEEIREARRKEAEARQEKKREHLENTKKSLKAKRKSKPAQVKSDSGDEVPPSKSSETGKKVSFK